MPLGPLGPPVVRSAVKGLKKKYPTEYNRDKVMAALKKVSAAVQAAPGGYLLGQFSYAGAILHADPWRVARD